MRTAATRMGALLLAASVAHAGDTANPLISITEAWISEPPPNAPAAAAYMEIRNDTGRAIALTGASAPRFGKIEIHESELRDGMASMRRLSRIDIPAGASVKLEPGRRHLMLFRKPPMPRDGDVIFMALQFSDGSLVGANVPVQRISGGNAPSTE